MAAECNTADDEGRFGYYAVCFLDVLGQSERLRKLNEISLSEGWTKELELALKETYGRVETVRAELLDLLLNTESRIAEDNPVLATHSSSFREQFMRWRNAKPNSQHISDTMVVYVPILNADGIYNLCALSGMVFAAGVTVLMGLARGTPIRGSIEVGRTGDFPNIGLYGPALLEAHNIEKHKAQYPRIVIGREMLAFLDTWPRTVGQPTTQQDTLKYELNARMTQWCKTMLHQDVDGLTMIDFMGSAIHEAASDVGIYRDLACKVHLFARREWARFREERNTKLAFRYKALVGYVESRLPLWCEGHTSTE